MIKAVVFDIGGVLIQDPWEWMLLNAKDNIADKFHLSRESVLKVGSKLWERYDRVTRGDVALHEQEKEWWIEFLAALPEKKPDLTARYLTNETEKYLEPIEPERTREVLDFLKHKNYYLGICSNNTEFWFAREWKKLGLENYFPKQNIILSQNVGYNKSSPGHEMFKALKESLNCEFQEILFIDDRKHNLESAAECGIQGLHVSGQSSEEMKDLYESLIKRIS